VHHRFDSLKAVETCVENHEPLAQKETKNVDDIRRMFEAEKAEQARAEAAIKEVQEAADAQRQAELETYEAHIQADAEERRLRADAELKERLKLAFMRNPAATEADFEKAWPELRQRALAEGENLGRDAQATIYHNTW
jgi:hypothetical protein